MTDRLIKIRFIGEGISTVAGQVTALGKSVGATADKMTSAEKDAVKFRRGLDTVGRSAGKVGLVAAAGLGAIVAATANFDQAMSNVAAATHESAANMELLRKAAIKAGADTVFSASEAAGAVENLAKAGVSTKDILGGGLRGALSLAAAGGLDVADAAEIAATALTQFKLSGRDVPHVADLLAAAAGKAQGDVSDLSFALKQSGLVASQMGISIEETTGTLAAFASAGLLGSDAGTSFRTMLLRLANPSAQSAKLMQKLGIAAYDAQGNFVGVAALSDQLQTAFKGQTQATKDAALATIFGSDAIRAANVLYDQGASGIQDWTRKVNDSGYAADTAARRMDNLKGDLEQLRGSLETALIGAGEGSQGPLRKLVQGLTDAVNAFNSLPGPIKNAVSGMLAITAITGGGLWFGAKVIGGIAKTRDALTNLTGSSEKATASLSRLGRLGARGGALLSVALAINAIGSALDDNVGNNVDASGLPDVIDDLTRGGAAGDLNTLAKALHGVNEAGAGAVNAIFKIPGSVVGIRTSFQHNTDVIKKWDAALREMADSGEADQAAQAFQMITEAAKDHGVSLKEVTEAFPRYQQAVIAGSDAANIMHDALFGLIPPTGDAAKATGALGAAAQSSAADLEAQAEALKKAREAASDTAHEFFNLGDSLNDSKVSLNDWIKDMAKQATALRDFTKNAQTAAKKGLKEGLIAALEQAGPEGARRMQQLANATDTEIARANRAWQRGQRAINHYVDVVGGVPPTVATTVSANTRGAIHDINFVDSLLTRLTRPRTANILIKTVGGLPIYKGQADGGTILGSRWPYGDKVLTPMAPGEEVTSNRYHQADNFRPELKDINAGLSREMVVRRMIARGLADGGTVGRMPAGALSAASALSLSLSDRDVDRIAGALLAARPMYGDVHVTDGYGGFKRQMEADRRLASRGGAPR